MPKYVGTSLQKVTVLTGLCSKKGCYLRADYRVERANDNPPKGFIKGGTISMDYCMGHLPADAQAMIDRAKS